MTTGAMRRARWAERILIGSDSICECGHTNAEHAKKGERCTVFVSRSHDKYDGWTVPYPCGCTRFRPR